MKKEFYHTKSQILSFNEDDWVFRRSSGFAGYDHKNHLDDEARWIYEEDYMLIWTGYLLFS